VVSSQGILLQPDGHKRHLVLASHVVQGQEVAVLQGQEEVGQTTIVVARRTLVAAGTFLADIAVVVVAGVVERHTRKQVAVEVLVVVGLRSVDVAVPSLVAGLVLGLRQLHFLLY